MPPLRRAPSREARARPHPKRSRSSKKRSPISTPSLPARISTGTVARGATFGLAAQFVDKLLPILIFLYLARALNAEAFGQYSFLIAYIALFQIVPEQSIDTVLVRTLTQSPDDKARVFRATLSLRMVMAVVGRIAQAMCRRVRALPSPQMERDALISGVRRPAKCTEST